jgi:hypothetical protein
MTYFVEKQDTSLVAVLSSMTERFTTDAVPAFLHLLGHSMWLTYTDIKPLESVGL